MKYSPFYTGGWASGETGGTPITPAALNHIEAGIAQTYSDLAPAGYGLGTYGTWVNDLNAADRCGYYSWTSTAQNIPFDNGNMFVIRRSDGRLTQIGIDPLMVGHGGIVIRHYTGSTWLPWAWLNPPLNLGVEYRTTERHNGKVVYIIRLTVGELVNNGTTQTTVPSTPTEIVELYGTVKSNSYTEELPFPLITLSGEVGGRLYKTGARSIVVKTFADYSGYTATATVKYTKD
jgi:hypothetical protein